MTQFDRNKLSAIVALKNLCSYCREGQAHHCPIRELAARIENLRGVPIIVNDRLHHVMFT